MSCIIRTVDDSTRLGRAMSAVSPESSPGLILKSENRQKFSALTSIE